jgi:macrodomain Ter protein organizer (MatP/YcbG family)
MKKTNTTCKWEEIVKEYPDSWVIITDVKESDGEIKTCKLLDVCTKDNKHEYIKKYLNSDLKFECQRTTFKAPNAGILL